MRNPRTQIHGLSQTATLALIIPSVESLVQTLDFSSVRAYWAKGTSNLSQIGSLVQRRTSPEVKNLRGTCIFCTFSRKGREKEQTTSLAMSFQEKWHVETFPGCLCGGFHSHTCAALSLSFWKSVDLRIPTGSVVW